jgi:predicted ATPase/DNA-binding CsgD family transcriptional regulator
MVSTNLIPPLTSFIGRMEELIEIKSLLSRTRPLTLTGVGGCGKTRLAMQVAIELINTQLYSDGIWWIDLVGLNDPNLIPQVVGQALNLREAPDTTSWTETLKKYLAPKHSLLVLDNCEHLLPTCGQLVKDLLPNCPNLQILATSREPLGIASETSWLVPSLLLPDKINFSSENHLILSHLIRSDAINLFVERASSILPKFTLTNQNAEAVTLICQRLDGLPLAIELAAARVHVLSVQQIADRLNDRFALLTGGNRTALIPRHQTLRTTMDWSYDLLSKQEQALFRRLSVFAGGFELEAVEAICSGDDVKVKDVLDLLSHLIDKSLVMVVSRESDVARYRLLETIRQYADERLKENHETENLRQHHASFFLELAERAKPELTGPDQKLWFERLDREKDNSRSAFNWLLKNEVEAAARLASGLFWYWHTYTLWSEGREWYDRLLKSGILPDESQPLTTAMRAQILYEAGWIAADEMDTSQSQVLSEQSLALYRELRDKRGVALVLNTLSWLIYYQSDFSKAKALAEESLNLYKEVEYKSKYENVLNLLGNIARAQGYYDESINYHREVIKLSTETGDKASAASAVSLCGYTAWLQGNLAEAKKLTEQGLKLSREVNLEWTVADNLTGLGDIACVQGDYQEASKLYDESNLIWERVGKPRERGSTVFSQGWLARVQGNHTQAIEFFKEALMLWREVGDKRHMVECLEGIAGVCTDLGKAEFSAKLMGAAEIIREETNSPLPPVYSANYDRDVVMIRAQLGETKFIKVWVEGRALKMEQTIEEAMQITSTQKSSVPFIAQPADSPERLNERELEILRLIARGLSNHEIANQLVLAVSTVKWYINNIFGKLHVGNRTQAVARARELKLL